MNDAPLTPREAGRLGGEATRDRHGSAHYAEAGRKGGKRTAERHDRAYYEALGRSAWAKQREQRRTG